MNILPMGLKLPNGKFSVVNKQLSGCCLNWPIRHSAFFRHEFPPRQNLHFRYLARAEPRFHSLARMFSFLTRLFRLEFVTIYLNPNPKGLDNLIQKEFLNCPPSFDFLAIGAETPYHGLISEAFVSCVIHSCQGPYPSNYGRR